MIAILGGGISGLSLAYYLAKRGCDVSLYEKAEQLGGVCRSVPLGDKTVDAFYHVLTGGENRLRGLIREVGLESHLFPIDVTQAYFQDGKIYPATKIRDLIAFPALEFSDRIRLGLTALRALLIQDWKSLDQKAAREWLIKVGGHRLFEHFWLPVMTCKFGPEVDRVAATDMWFRIRRLGAVSLLGEGGGACYMRGTLSTLIGALDEKLRTLGVKVFKETTVERLITERDSIKAIALEEGQIHEFDTVISTIPTPNLVKLLPDTIQEYKSYLSQIEYLHNICLILKTTQPITAHYQLNLGNADIPFTGVIGADCFYPPEEYGGYVTYLPRYFSRQEDLFAKDADDLLGEYNPHLKQICPGFQVSWITDMTIVRGTNVEPLHTVGYAQQIPSNQTPIKGLFLFSTSQIYPEPTILDTVANYAFKFSGRLVQEYLG